MIEIICTISFIHLPFFNANKLGMPLLIGSVYPTRQVAYTGSNTRIYCCSTGIVKWTTNKLSSRQLVVERNTLMLQNVSDNDIGIYTCQGYDGFGVPFIVESELAVGGTVNVAVNLCNVM